MGITIKEGRKYRTRDGVVTDVRRRVPAGESSAYPKAAWVLVYGYYQADGTFANGGHPSLDIVAEVIEVKAGHRYRAQGGEVVTISERNDRGNWYSEAHGYFNDSGLYLGFNDLPDYPMHLIEDLGPVEPAIQLREGHRYRTRDGDEVTILGHDTGDDTFQVSNHAWYCRDGRYYGSSDPLFGMNIVEDLGPVETQEPGDSEFVETTAPYHDGIKTDGERPWKAPSDRATRKATPIYSGFVRYFPDAMAAVAQLSYDANSVHNPGEPLHWSKDKSNDHGDCLARHLTDGLDTYDVEPDGAHHYLHAVKLFWRAGAYLQTLLESGKAPRVAKGEL